MIAVFTLWLFSFPGLFTYPASPATGRMPASGLPGDLVFVAPEAGQEAAPFFIDAGAPPHDLPAAPTAGVSQDDRLTARAGNGPFDAPLPLNLSLETWQGTLCVKGAWSIRAAAQVDRTGDLEAFRDLQISPAVLADGARLGPGIGASTHF